MPQAPETLDERARNRIRVWIASTGITQTTLADRIGRNQAWMSRYLAGDFDADLETLAKMAAVFSHPLTALLDLPSNPEEFKLIEAFRALRPEGRRIALSLFDDWSRASSRGRGRSRK